MGGGGGGAVWGWSAAPQPGDWTSHSVVARRPSSPASPTSTCSTEVSVLPAPALAPKGSCPGKRLPQALLDTAVAIGSDPGVWQGAQQTSPG